MYLYYLRMVSQSVKSSSPTVFFKTLRDSLGFVELFRHLSNVHFYVKNRQGEFMAANLPSLLRNGLREEVDILGKTDFDFHPPEMAAAYRAEDQLVMDSNESLPDQVWLVYDHLNIQQWFLCTKVPLHDAKGEVIGVAGAMKPLETTGPDSPYVRFGPAVNYVLRRYDEKLKVPFLAELTGCSVSQFDRGFRRMFSMSPTQYILRVRVNAARNMLSTSGSTIAEIALSSGFYDQAQLARYFKQITGMTPSNYRSQFRTS